MAIRATMSVLGLYTWDNTIFDNFNVPTGMDKSTAVSDILWQCANLEIGLPDPDILKSMIGVWSTKNAQAWQDLYDSTQFDYDPIANVDADERTTRNGKQGGSVTTVGETAAYNSTAYQPEAKTTVSPSTNWNDFEQKTRHGNIGVTSTQTLIKEQREVVNYNVYDVITKSFKETFCLGVYC